MQETIYETYTRTVCRICKNQKECKEELRKRINNTIKCDKFETTKEKINYKNCMKRKCNECKYYKSCFKNNKSNKRSKGEKET